MASHRSRSQYQFEVDSTAARFGPGNAAKYARTAQRDVANDVGVRRDALAKALDACQVVSPHADDLEHPELIVFRLVGRVAKLTEHEQHIAAPVMRHDLRVSLPARCGE